MRCAVATCNSDNQSKTFSKNVMFFRFPTEESVQKVWIHTCKRGDKFNIKNARICSKHFSEECYERNLKYELLNYSAKNHRLLKTDAIPTLHLTNNTIQFLEPKQTNKKDPLRKRNQKKVVKNIPLTYECQDVGCSSDNNGHSSDVKINLMPVLSKNTSSSLLRKEIGIMTDNDGKDETILKLKEEIERLKSKKKAIQKIFSPTQIQKLKNPKKRATWTIEDIVSAIVIHSASARAYKMLFKKGYPLPAASTLKAWCKKIKLEPGLLKQVFMVVKKTDLSDLQKLCVLSFDEIKVRSVYLYDKANDTTLKPYSYVQVAVLRGLFGNWKQPIFFEYDCKMTKEKLFDIIQFAENAGFRTVAMVSDLGGSNRGLQKELNINMAQTWFINPVNNEKIYVFADVPHLIELLRNNFLDQGFMLNGVIDINKDILEKLIRISSTTDLNIAHKISMESLHLKGVQGQNVKLATKLFSDTISRAISQCGILGKFDSENWIECAEFFKDVNDWFDCLNVRVPEEDNQDRKKAFGMSLDLQISILDKMSKVISKLRVKGRTSLLPFQKDILITNTSIKLLYNDLKCRHSIKYILTYRLNQDVLKNMFEAIWTKEGHEHLDPLEFKYRLKAYILGLNEGSLSDAENIEQDDLESNGDLLSKKCFSQLVDPVFAGHVVPDPLIVELHELHDNGLENLAEFICQKIRKDEPSESCSYQERFMWVDHLSEGGLKKPSEELMIQLQQLDHIFDTINSDSILTCKGYLLNLINMSSHVTCSDKTKTLFFKSRMYLRLRILNKALQDKGLSKKRKIS